MHAISAEGLPFVLPVASTIGPRADHEECLRYAELISPHDKHSHQVNELAKTVIEGKTRRVLAASITMEDIFKGTKSFEQAVSKNVQLELNQFGLIVYSAYGDVMRYECFVVPEAEGTTPSRMRLATRSATGGEDGGTARAAKVDADVADLKPLIQRGGDVESTDDDIDLPDASREQYTMLGFTVYATQSSAFTSNLESGDFGGQNSSDFAATLYGHCKSSSAP